MLNSRFNVDALRRIDAHLLLDQIPALGADIVRDREVASRDLLAQLNLVHTRPRELADDHHIQDHAEAPDVGPPRVVRRPDERLGRGVAHRPAGRRDKILRARSDRESEIRELDPAAGVAKDVLGLEVSVGKAQRVEVPEGRREATGDYRSLALGEKLPLDNVVVKLAVRAVLE